MSNNNELKRGLSARQMRMIALGGTIGVGLFMGATSTIKWTGPSVIFAYLIAGLFIFLVMRAMGEMVYVHPTTGSFASFASDYIHPVAGYLTAWSNIFQWIVVGMSEVIAVGEYMNYWFPELPQWIPGVIVVMLLLAANLTSVKAFGEFEFWFAMIKVVTIILMIIAGFGLIFFGLGNGGEAIGLSNLWSHGGFFPNGWVGFFFALSIVIGSYQGVELIGITAGETKDPHKNIKSAVNGVIWRILIFYIGAIFVIVTVYPWDELGSIGSPFVATFAKVGITFAAGFINFVVLTAAMSGCNSGIFSASRMTYTLANYGQLPRCFTRVMKNGVPFYAVLAIGTGILIGAALALWVRCRKNKTLRDILKGALPVGILGIGEPLIYGVTLPLGRPFITACIGGGIGGAVIGGIGHIGAIAIGPSGLSLLPLISDHMYLGYIAGILAAYAGGFLFTYFFGTTKAMRESDTLGG